MNRRTAARFDHVVFCLPGITIRPNFVIFVTTEIEMKSNKSTC